MKYKEFINILLGTLLVIGPFTIFNVCDYTKKVMKCMHSSIFVAIIGMIIVLINILLIKNGVIGSKWSDLTVVLFILCILIPRYVVGGCSDMSMRCNKLTFPCIYLIAILGIIMNCFIEWVRRSESENKKVNV